MSVNLTPASRDLFLALVEDAPNWSGRPLVEVSPAERGNLTQLKREGLISTMIDGGYVFAAFTAKGKAFAAANGFDPAHLY